MFIPGKYLCIDSSDLGEILTCFRKLNIQPAVGELFSLECWLSQFIFKQITFTFAAPTVVIDFAPLYIASFNGIFRKYFITDYIVDITQNSLILIIHFIIKFRPQHFTSVVGSNRTF